MIDEPTRNAYPKEANQVGGRLLGKLWRRLAGRSATPRQSRHRLGGKQRTANTDIDGSRHHDLAILLGIETVMSE